MKNIGRLILTGLLIASIAGCGDDDPAAPSPPPNVNATVEIYALTVRKSCDGSGAGDFFSQVKVYLAPKNKTETLLAESPVVLKQYEAGPNYPRITELIATATVPLVDGQRLRFTQFVFENDPGGVHHAEVGGAWVFVYDAATGCWVHENTGNPCSATNGTLREDTALHMYDTTSIPTHPCDVLVQGNVIIEKE